MPLDSNICNTLSNHNTMMPHPFLRRLAIFTSLSTLFLIFVGGMVKSTESGLAVPDWPLSYGTLFPPMVGGVFYEHGHRMVASFVGLLMLMLAVSLTLKETRLWVKVLGWACFIMVVFQGLLGGITVLFFLPTPISVLHAVLAQTFFVLTVILAYSQSFEYYQRYAENESPVQPGILKLSIFFILLVFAQLIIGALMRHTNSGLAIPDFPKSGGMWIPLFNETMLVWINNWRFENNLDFVSMGQVLIHFAHRMGAVILLIAIIFLNKVAFNENNRRIKTTLLILNHLFVIQIFLGIISVLTVKEPVTTSVHVALGAATLGFSVLLLLRSGPVKYQKFMNLLTQS